MWHSLVKSDENGIDILLKHVNSSCSIIYSFQKVVHKSMIRQSIQFNGGMLKIHDSGKEISEFLPFKNGLIEV